MGKMLREVSLEAIQLGKAVECVDEELRRICQDVLSRPRIKDKRTVTLKIEIVPEVDEDTGINIPVIEWNVNWAIPGRKGMTTRAFVDDDGRLKVNMHDPSGREPNQPNLLDMQNVVAR